jgi:hypothetical protein
MAMPNTLEVGREEYWILEGFQYPSKIRAAW